MNVKTAVVERFQELCSERDIAINTLATLAGITPSTVYSMLDSDRKDIGIVTIKKLCDGLDLTITEFFQSELFYNLKQEIN